MTPDAKVGPTPREALEMADRARFVKRIRALEAEKAGLLRQLAMTPDAKQTPGGGTSPSGVSPSPPLCPSCGHSDHPSCFDEDHNLLCEEGCIECLKDNLRVLEATNESLARQLADAKESLKDEGEQIVHLSKATSTSRREMDLIESNRGWAAAYVKQRTRAEKAEARVKELEAELAGWKESSEQAEDFWEKALARAEKAEALAKAPNCFNENHQNLEAHVKELENLLREIADPETDYLEGAKFLARRALEAP